MAVRTPVYWDATLNSGSGGLREMTTAAITAIKTEAAHQYGLNPSVDLSTSSGTLLTTQTDNYRVAGADSTNVSTYVTPGGTGTGSANFSLYQNVESVSAPTFSDKEAPLYWTGTQLQQFSVQDFIDTFIDGAIDILVASSGPGTYYTSGLGSTTLFVDRVYDDARVGSSYVSDDTTQTVTYTEINNTYYLNQYAAGTSLGFTAPAGWDSTNNRIQPLADASFQSLLQEFVRYQAVQSSAGIRYAWSTSAPSGYETVNSRGATIDTQRSGTTQYNQFINGNDYRSRNFPTGGLTTTETITFYVIKL